jgi:hypothetical protein
MPGGLIPGDQERIAQALGVQDFALWARESLQASQGAEIPHAGRVFRLPTIVPGSRPDGSCIFLQEDRCTVHAVSPFGCAYLDMHMSREEANQRSAAALLAVATDWATKGPYSRLWGQLYQAGRIAPSLEERQANMHRALAVIEQNHEQVP